MKRTNDKQGAKEATAGKKDAGKKIISKKCYQKPQVKPVAIGCVMLPTYDGD